MTTTDQAGRYQLSYTFESLCEPTDDTTDYIEASAEGYVTGTSLSSDPDGPLFSDPPIYCTSEPQVINLSLQPIPAE